MLILSRGANKGNRRAVGLAGFLRASEGKKRE